MNPYRPYVVVNNVEPTFSITPEPTFETQPTISKSEIFETLRSILVTKYLTTFFVQPLEVAKTVCQVEEYLPKRTKIERDGKQTKESYDEDIPDGTEQEGLSDDEHEIYAYFETPTTEKAVTEQLAEKLCVDASGYVTDPSNLIERSYTIHSKRFSIKSIISELWEKEGARGLWKGHTISFLHNLLYSGLQSWLSATLSGALAIADPNIISPIDSVRPLLSLFIKSITSAISALILSPLDIARTKIILFPISSSSYLSSASETSGNSHKKFKPLTIRQCLKALPFYCPSSLILPTVCYVSLPPFVSSVLPLTFRNFLGSSPTLDAMVGLGTSAVQFLLKCPLEMVLRRAQAQYECNLPPQTIVPVGKYTGIVGTIWCLLSEEDPGKFGIEGLYRGWRVGIWGMSSTLALNYISSNLREEVEF